MRKWFLDAKNVKEEENGGTAHLVEKLESIQVCAKHIHRDGGGSETRL